MRTEGFIARGATVHVRIIHVFLLCCLYCVGFITYRTLELMLWFHMFLMFYLIFELFLTNCALNWNRDSVLYLKMCWKGLIVLQLHLTQGALNAMLLRYMFIQHVFCTEHFFANCTCHFSWLLCFCLICCSSSNVVQNVSPHSVHRNLVGWIISICLLNSAASMNLSEGEADRVRLLAQLP